MATIHEEVLIDVEPAAAWSALADWGALHERLARGFVLDTQLDGADRIVTFASGVSVREVMIASDAEARRLVWSVVDGPYTHHNGAAQILATPDGRTRFVWIADLLPDAAAAPTAEAMRQGLAAIKKTLERDGP
jgi:Polyketide cyclase / dehydrase and lipid transport